MSARDLLTVTEAAAVLRIGRMTACELVRSDFASGGAEGLGVVRIGGQFLIPRVALERLVGGPVSWPADGLPADAAAEPTGPAVPDEPVAAPRSSGRKRGGSVPAPMCRSTSECRAGRPGRVVVECHLVRRTCTTVLSPPSISSQPPRRCAVLSIGKLAAGTGG